MPTPWQAPSACPSLGAQPPAGPARQSHWSRPEGPEHGRCWLGSERERGCAQGVPGIWAPPADHASPLSNRKSKAKPNGKKPGAEEKKAYLEPEHAASRIVDLAFKELVVLPREIDLNEWLASNSAWAVGGPPSWRPRGVGLCPG